MTPDQFREICDWANRREEKFYAWLRFLVGLAAVSLSVLAVLPSAAGATASDTLLRKVSWTGLGLGILLGALALHGEVWIERALVKSLVQQRTQPTWPGSDAAPSPIVAKLPWPYRWAVPGCYLSLAMAVGSLVTSVWLR
jgi:hypothetical protein